MEVFFGALSGLHRPQALILVPPIADEKSYICALTWQSSARLLAELGSPPVGAFCERPLLPTTTIRPVRRGSADSVSLLQREKVSRSDG